MLCPTSKRPWQKSSVCGDGTVPPGRWIQTSACPTASTESDEGRFFIHATEKQQQFFLRSWPQISRTWTVVFADERKTFRHTLQPDGLNAYQTPQSLCSFFWFIITNFDFHLTESPCIVKTRFSHDSDSDVVQCSIIDRNFGRAQCLHFQYKKR